MQDLEKNASLNQNRMTAVYIEPDRWEMTNDLMQSLSNIITRVSLDVKIIAGKSSPGVALCP